jgi:hypothetical protein
MHRLQLEALQLAEPHRSPAAGCHPGCRSFPAAISQLANQSIYRSAVVATRRLDDDARSTAAASGEMPVCVHQHAMSRVWVGDCGCVTVNCRESLHLQVGGDTSDPSARARVASSCGCLKYISIQLFDQVEAPDLTMTVCCGIYLNAWRAINLAHTCKVYAYFAWRQYL